MKLVSNLIIAVSLLTVIACKDTKKEEAAAAVTIEKVEAAEAELEAVTKELEQKAEELDNSLNALDDI